MERNTNTATLVRDEDVTDEADTITANAADDFFSDAPLDADSAVTGKVCNVWDPECEACQ